MIINTHAHTHKHIYKRKSNVKIEFKYRFSNEYDGFNDYEENTYHDKILTREHKLISFLN